MNKILKSIVILVVLAVAMVSASAVFAQSSTPGASLNESGSGYSRRGRGGNGSGGSMLNQNFDSKLQGSLHDELVAAFADALGLEVEDIDTRLEEGETMAEIALSTGMTLEDFHTIMDEVRRQVIDQAVEEGILTKEQAEWMKTHRTRSFEMEGLGRGRGKGQGMYGEGNCTED